MTIQETLRHLDNEITATKAAVARAKEVETSLQDVRDHADEVAEEVRRVAHFIQQLDDQSGQTHALISVTEEKIKALSKAADKSEKLGAELTSRAANLEREISEARAKELGIEDRMDEIAGYLRQQRSTRTIDNRRLLEFQLDEEKKECELKLELERAEQRTVHYEEIRVRIGLMEKQLAKIVARGDSAEERGNMNQELLEEQIALQKQRELESIEHNSQEDNLLEEVRQKRELVQAAEDRFEFAEKKRIELDAIAKALTEQLLQAKKQAQLLTN